MLLIYVLLLNTAITSGELTEHFKSFLNRTYGDGSGTRFERSDLGITASFGGRRNDDDKIKNQVNF